MSFDDAIGHVASLARAFEMEDDGTAEFRQWYAENFQSGDELWWYNKGGWSDMAGEAGFAIVRNDVTAFMLAQIRN